MLACRVCLLESNEYNYSAGRECNFLHALHSASLPANLPSVRMCNTCGGKIRAKWERWAALLWASVCAESCSSTAASLSCLPDHWTWSRVHTWNRKCGGAYLHAGIQKKKNVKRRNKGTHTQRYIDFAVCPNSLLCTKKQNNNYQLAYSQFMQGYEKLQNYFPMLFAPAFMYPLTHFHMFKRLNPFEFLLLYSVKAI